MANQITLLEGIAKAALERDSLQLRELVLELLHEHPDLSQVAPIPRATPQEHAVAAAILELLASRRGQNAPAWTTQATNSDPVFLVRAAETMPRLRELCQTESPEPLRKRQFYAPPNFLEFA